MSTNDDIAKRALRFAETFQFTNPVIVQTKPARHEFVVRYGTPDSTEYRETEIHLDWGANQQEIINKSKIVERQEGDRVSAGCERPEDAGAQRFLRSIRRLAVSDGFDSDARQGGRGADGL